MPKEESKTANQAQTLKQLRNSDETLSVPKNSASSESKTLAHQEASLTELASDKVVGGAKGEGKEVAAKEEEKKLTLGQKIKKELNHYWDGTKLLAKEVKISMKLAIKMAAGYELSRRENRQV